MATKIENELLAVKQIYEFMNNDNITQQNSLRDIRESIMMSKSELARKARISAGTISRIEQGYPCRVQTQNKILLALGFKISDKDKVSF